MSIIRIETALDWIQFSFPLETQIAEDAKQFAYMLRSEQEGEGYLAKSLSVHGYFGWSVGSVAYLIHDKRSRAMLKVSSDLAAKRSEYLAILALDPQASVTRLDLQATIWYTAYRPGVAKLLRDRVKAIGRLAATPRSHYIDGIGNGDTMYIGAPASDKRIRVYDKYKESGGDEDYRFAWRYEVQYRSHYAKNVLRQWEQAGLDSEACAAIINSEFEKYEVVVVPDVRAAERPKGARRDTDLDRRIRWLRNQVAPAAREIAYSQGWDYILSVLKGEINA